MSRRLFVSVDCDGLADDIAAVQARLPDADGLDRTDPEQAHVTLQVLGDTDPDRVSDIVAALESAVEAAGIDPFAAELGGLGVFPSMAYISVVWLGVRSGGEQLVRLQEAIEPRVVELGFEADDHDFTPHVTLARMRHAGPKAAVQRAVRESDPDAGTLAVEEVRLTESVLTEAGPEYTTLAAVPLS
jgi:2'-5' RNA ligase